MAKSKQSKKNKQNKAAKKPKTEASAPRLTLEELDAISSDEEGGERGPRNEADDEWNAEALALRQAIKEGAFDRLLQNKLSDNKDDEASEDEMEEASLNDESVEQEDDEDDDDEQDDEEQQEVDGDEEEEEQEAEDDDDDDDEQVDEDDKKEAGDDDASSAASDDDDDDDAKPKGGEEISRKALSTVTQELIAAKRDMPWVETFSIIPPTPLPFAPPTKKKVTPLIASNNTDEGIDVHDDLKRELAFYNMALEAVGEAKAKCKEDGIPFSRPLDFFAEMVKTDDHMAKVKDRLIFETKKMEAVAQRKSNKEQKLRVRETHDNKLAEKAKRKKDHQRAVDDWAKSSQQSGGGGGGDDSKGRGPNKKRLAADKRYGHGGPKGRFKQNDRKSLDDMSGFNPRGNFAGKGTKRTRSSSGGKSGGGNRPGKRSRDEGRARRRST